MPLPRQRGAYALEFGLVFGFLVILVYAVVLFGVYFTTSQLMTWAAEDGARAALRHAPDLPARLTEANRVARLRAEPFQVELSHHVLAAEDCGAVASEAGVCLRLGVAGEAPVPLAPGLGLLLPAWVSGHAQVYLPGVIAGPTEGI